MKTIVIMVAAILATGCGTGHHESTGHHQEGDHANHGHGDHHSHSTTGELQVRPASGARAGEPVPLSLTIRGTDGKPVAEFETVHGEKVHLIIVREGLDQFAHLHPALSGSGELSVTHTFPIAGKYRLFADYRPLGGTSAVAVGSITVAGTAPDAEPLAANVPGKVHGDGLTADVALSPSPAGNAVRIQFRVHDEAGKAVADLEPYLAELGHLVFVSADATRYVHVHPVGGDRAKGMVEFDAHFPVPGHYKGWAQFKRGGRVHTVPLVTLTK